MRVNVGGELQPDEVVGRDKLIQGLWRRLERQSLVLSAERRMGKTSIVKKMTAQPPQDKLPIYQDLEGIRSPLGFAEKILNDLERHLSILGRTQEQARGWLKNLKGMEIGGIIKFPDDMAEQWKPLLIKTVQKLVDYQKENKDKGKTVVFFWDEMPLMLDNIKKDKGEPAAMEVLDTLRSLRQTYSGLRMVYTGSIGLHNVLAALRRAGYANAPINDMYREDVPPLSEADAQDLALQLLEGEKVQAGDLAKTAGAIAAAANGMPYFIQHIVDEMVDMEEPVTSATAGKIVTEYLSDPQDRWDLRHYRERISIYYQEEEIPIALNLLDVLANADRPLPFNELYDELKTRLPSAEGENGKEKTREVLILLQSDHYVIQEKENRAYRFRYQLIEQYWRQQRG